LRQAKEFLSVIECGFEYCDVLSMLVVELQIPTLAVLAATAEQCPRLWENEE